MQNTTSKIQQLQVLAMRILQAKGTRSSAHPLPCPLT
jgi:hypothetical protein